MRRVPIARIQKKIAKRKERTKNANSILVEYEARRKRTDPVRIHKYELENIRTKFRAGKTNKEIMKELKISRPTLMRYYRRIGGLTFLDKSEHYKNLERRKESGEFDDYLL